MLRNVWSIPLRAELRRFRGNTRLTLAGRSSLDRGMGSIDATYIPRIVPISDRFALRLQHRADPMPELSL